jgi:hypothetical protein
MSKALKKAVAARLDDIAKGIIRDHVTSSVTGLVEELVEHDSEMGREIMYGDPESELLAYDAKEVWAVTDWLARQLRRHGHRALCVGGWWYWARKDSGQSLYLDTVIQDIAQNK